MVTHHICSNISRPMLSVSESQNWEKVSILYPHFECGSQNITIIHLVGQYLFCDLYALIVYRKLHKKSISIKAMKCYHDPTNSLFPNLTPSHEPLNVYLTPSRAPSTEYMCLTPSHAQSTECMYILHLAMHQAPNALCM